MDMWLDAQIFLTLPQEAVDEHIRQLKKIRRKRSEIQFKNSNVDADSAITAGEGADNN